MGLTVVGVSHRTAPIEIRERLVYSGESVVPELAAMRGASDATEALLLSTCNRTELYFVDGARDPVQPVWDAFASRLGEPAAEYGYVFRDKDAVSHLFRVASGMDSMILGEAQIHGQVRRAWEVGRASSGVVLTRLFQSALSVASRVRTETALARGAASVSSAAVLLAKQIFGSLQGRRAMVLGAGEMAELALECLSAEGVRASVVANRTYDRAQELAQRYGAVAMHYDECWRALGDVDVLLCSTASRNSVVRPSDVQPALSARGGRPLCILDIALPRDVDPAVRKLGNVYLYDLDDLQAVVTANLERRRGELPSAEQVVAGETTRFWDWLAGLAAVPVVTQVRTEMERLRERELANLLRRLPELTQSDRDTIEHFSRTLMNKFLHEPTVRLRTAAANGRGLAVVDAARYLFALEAASAPSVGESDAETADGSREGR